MIRNEIYACCGYIFNTERIAMLDDEFCLTLDRENSSYFPMYDMLRAWNKVARKYRNGEITKEEYDNWRYNYPESNTSEKQQKILPSEELSDMLADALKQETAKRTNGDE